MAQMAERVVLVTGAGGGIGRVTAAALAAAGAKAVLVADVSADALAGLVDDVEAAGVPATALVADLRTPAGCAGLVDAALAVHDRVDVLVSTAAVAHPRVPFLEVPDELWETEVAMNLGASFHLGRGLGRAMARTGGGCLLYTGSIATLGAGRGMAAYTATKSGLLGLVRAMAIELAPHGVRVNLVSPGAVDTPRYRMRITDPAELERLRAHFAPAPLDRMATPEDVAGAFVYLASPAAGYITGHNLVVDGGTSAQVRTPHD